MEERVEGKGVRRPCEPSLIGYLMKEAFLVYYLAMYRDDATHLHVLAGRSDP